MKKLVSFLVSAALAAIFLIPKIIEMSSQQIMLMYSLLPLLAERIHLDPAVMASPFISTVVDVVTLIIYLQVARAILHI